MIEKKIDEAANLAPKVDNFLTVWGSVAKKHWGKLIVLFILVVFGWFCSLVYTDIDENGLEGSTEYYEDTLGYE